MVSLVDVAGMLETPGVGGADRRLWSAFLSWMGWCGLEADCVGPERCQAGSQTLKQYNYNTVADILIPTPSVATHKKMTAQGRGATIQHSNHITFTTS